MSPQQRIRHHVASPCVVTFLLAGDVAQTPGGPCMLMFGFLFPRTLETSIFPKPSINKPSAFASINIKQKNLPHPNFISGLQKKHPSVVCPSLIMEIEVSPILIVEMFSCAGTATSKIVRL